ncbi:MAG: class I SAM-dependent methyltransferase [Parcubacteria group bacterium]
MTEEKKETRAKRTVPLSSGEVQFLNPQNIVAGLEMRLGMKVAHFGCGTGYFTFPIAARIGETGKIWALDILDYKIDMIRAQAKNLGLRNVIEKKVNLEEKDGSTLEEASADWVIMVNVLYQNDKKSRILGEAKRILKEDGHILLIDWKNSHNSFGPEMGTRIAHEDLIKLVRKNGLGIKKELDINKFYFGMILGK